MNRLFLVALFSMTYAPAAIAGIRPLPVPAPLLGFGPWGLVLAAAGYGGYRLYRNRKNR